MMIYDSRLASLPTVPWTSTGRFAARGIFPDVIASKRNDAVVCDGSTLQVNVHLHSKSHCVSFPTSPSKKVRRLSKNGEGCPVFKHLNPRVVVPQPISRLCSTRFSPSTSSLVGALFGSRQPPPDSWFNEIFAPRYSPLTGGQTAGVTHRVFWKSIVTVGDADVANICFIMASFNSYSLSAARRPPFQRYSLKFSCCVVIS